MHVVPFVPSNTRIFAARSSVTGISMLRSLLLLLLGLAIALTLATENSNCGSAEFRSRQSLTVIEMSRVFGSSVAVRGAGGGAGGTGVVLFGACKSRFRLGSKAMLFRAALGVPHVASCALLSFERNAF